MAIQSVGLQTYIWNNNLRSILILLFYPVLLLTLCGTLVMLFALFSGASDPATAWKMTLNVLLDYGWMVLAAAGFWFLISFFFHGAMVRSLSHSHPVTRAQEPVLYNLLENLCIARGMRMPRLEVIETHARNAFASGIGERSYAITVTRGLINSLEQDELEGVLAHELTHIVNRDVRLLIVTIIFTGMIGFLAQTAASNLRFSFYAPRSRETGKTDPRLMLFMLAAVMVLYIGYFATMLTRFALSRRREFMADAGAVTMTRNPEAMMRALMRISKRDRIPVATDDIALMCVHNSQPFMGLFSTHPPIETRIAALSRYTGAPVPQDLSSVSAPVAIPPRQNPWLVRQRRGRQ